MTCSSLVARTPHVVLDVSGVAKRPAFGLGDRLAVVETHELSEDLLVWLPQNVSQDVQPPAVGHSHGHLGYACGRHLAQHLVEDRNQHVGAFDRETLLPDEGTVEVPLEDLDRCQSFEERPLLRCIELDTVASGFDRFFQPLAFSALLYVTVIEPDRATVDLTQALDRLARIAGIACCWPADQRGR